MTKLLIVDDEPLTVDMLKTFLQLNGYETVGVLSGEDGLAMLLVEEPEILILDLMLPDIEGYEVCSRIRNDPKFTACASMPVLVLSARTEESSRKRAAEAGADAYLTKPVRFTELLAALNRLQADQRAKAIQAAWEREAEEPPPPRPQTPDMPNEPRRRSDNTP